MTKRELIQFMDELVELASGENRSRAILVKEKFINDFERSYEYEKEVRTEVTELSPQENVMNMDVSFVICMEISIQDGITGETYEITVRRLESQLLKFVQNWIFLYLIIKGSNLYCIIDYCLFDIYMIFYYIKMCKYT